MKVEGDIITFSSGRTAYAHQGIIGLNAEAVGGDPSLYQGCDGIIFVRQGPDVVGDEVEVEDMRELADYMVDLWTQYKARLG